MPENMVYHHTTKQSLLNKTGLNYSYKKGRNCGTALEHTIYNREIVGLILG